MELIDIDGETFRILGRGAEDEQGRVYMHLASESKFIQQKNGKRPQMRCEWVDPSKVYELAVRQSPRMPR